MITSEVFKEGRRGRTRGSYLLKKQRGWGGWVERRWPLLFHQGEAGLFRKKRNTFGISGLILRRFGEGRASFGSTNPSVRHTLSSFQCLTYQDSGQPRTQGLSSIRPLSLAPGTGRTETLGIRLDSRFYVSSKNDFSQFK